MRDERSVVPILTKSISGFVGKILRKSKPNSEKDILFALTGNLQISVIHEFEKSDQPKILKIDIEKGDFIVDFRAFEDNKLLVLTHESDIFIYKFDLKKGTSSIFKEIEIDAGPNSKPYLCNISNDDKFISLVFSSKIKIPNSTPGISEKENQMILGESHRFQGSIDPIFEQSEKKRKIEKTKKIKERNSILLFRVVDGYNLKIWSTVKIKKTKKKFLNMKLFFQGEDKKILAFDNSKIYAWKLGLNNDLVKVKCGDDIYQNGVAKLSIGRDFHGTDVIWWVDGECKINCLKEY